MPVEFALRPRIQLREAAPKPRRGRARLPRFALPAAAYWLAMAGLTYAYVHYHQPPEAPAAGETAQLAEPEREAPRAWWRRMPASQAAEKSSPTAEPAAVPAVVVPPVLPAAEPEPEPAALPHLASEPEPEPERSGASLPAHSRAAAALDLPPERGSSAAEAPPRPEHAALPQLALRSPLDVLDEPRPAAPEPTPPAALPPSNTRANGSLPSCEQAIASAHQDIDFSAGNGTADLPTNVIAAVLENGAWLSTCNVPASTTLDVCVAIRGGNVIGASVTARPQNPELAGCVRRRASGLQFPYSSHVDIARTRF